jgi:hypothetical protein
MYVPQRHAPPGFLDHLLLAELQELLSLLRALGEALGPGRVPNKAADGHRRHA